MAECGYFILHAKYYGQVWQKYYTNLILVINVNRREKCLLDYYFMFLFVVLHFLILFKVSDFLKTSIIFVGSCPFNFDCFQMVCFYVLRIVGRINVNGKMLTVLVGGKSVFWSIDYVQSIDYVYQLIDYIQSSWGVLAKISFKGKGGKKPKTLSACLLYICH